MPMAITLVNGQPVCTYSGRVVEKREHAHPVVDLDAEGRIVLRRPPQSTLITYYVGSNGHRYSPQEVEGVK